MLADVLKESGFAATAVASAVEMDAALKNENVDLVVLDIMLPGEDGLEHLQAPACRLRESRSSC